MENNKNHTMQIEYGQGFISSCTDEVLFFSDKQVKFSLKTSEKCLVLGENLKISSFNKQTGELKVLGFVSAVKYLQTIGQKIKKTLS